jgi:16S rRNA (cytidine1402-2'-O)-methyltransferase
MAKLKGKLFLLPTPIDENGLESIPPEAMRIMHGLDHFIVERARTSRRYISTTKPPKSIESLQIEEMPEDVTNMKLMEEQLQPILEGIDMGIMSEAGLPAVADPGNKYVAIAHRLGIRVVPVSGPSSIMMALIGSGLEGQRFTFHGYLSAKKDELASQLKDLERKADREDATQIWIEAPYRNKQVLEAVERHLDPKRMFCIAAGLGSKDGFVLTRQVNAWRRSGWPEIHKIPAVFLLK